MKKMIHEHTSGEFKGLWGRNMWDTQGAKWREYFPLRSMARAPMSWTTIATGEYLTDPRSHHVMYMVTITETFPGSPPIKHCESATYSQAKLIYAEEKRQGRACGVKKITTETVMECKGR